MATSVAEFRQSVVFREDCHGRPPFVADSGCAKCGLEASDPPFDGKAADLESIRQPRGCLKLLEPYLWVCVDALT